MKIKDLIKTLEAFEDKEAQIYFSCDEEGNSIMKQCNIEPITKQGDICLYPFQIAEELD